VLYQSPPTLAKRYTVGGSVVISCPRIKVPSGAVPKTKGSADAFSNTGRGTENTELFCPLLGPINCAEKIIVSDGSPIVSRI